MAGAKINPLLQAAIERRALQMKHAAKSVKMQTKHAHEAHNMGIKHAQERIMAQHDAQQEMAEQAGQMPGGAAPGVGG